MRTLVIGDGGWGTALALLLLENGHEATLWSAFPEHVATMRQTRRNNAFLPGIELPSALRLTSDREEAAEKADVAVLAVPTKFFRSVVDSFTGVLPHTCQVVSVAKGFDETTHKRMSEVAEELLGNGPVSALSGPSHAEEVARRIPTAVALASADPGQSAFLQAAFANNRFRVYTSTDVIGVELGGALKNVVAIAVGVSDGIGFGDNTRAALITRGLAEMARLGRALGAQATTFAGLSGMGDLIVTCTSGLSRNRAVGERLGQGESIDRILKSMQQVAEGVWNCKTARGLARETQVEMPITEQVYAVVHEGQDAHEAVEALLARDVRPE